MQSTDLSETTADPISRDRVADFVGHREADPVVRPLCLAAINDQSWSSGTVPFGVETPELVILF